MTKHSPHVLVAASGSGGHLFPATFIIKALQELDVSAQVEFVGSGKELERRIVGPHGVPINVIDIVGVKNRGVLGFLRFLVKLPAAFLETRRLFDRFKPDLVIGVGGYATVLPVLVARLRGIPSWIHEAERKPGLANAVLSFFATKISIAFEDARVPCQRKTVFTGHPLRPELCKSVDLESQGERPPTKLLLVGGSQGASSIDQASISLASWFSERGFEVRHQARKENIASVEGAFREAHVSGEVFEFIEDIAQAYHWADLVVARSGAGTVLELGVVNRPAIFVPYPHAQGNHQHANATLLADRGKALIVAEGPEFVERLRQAITDLSGAETYWRMRQLPLVDRSRHAAQDIAKQALELISL